MTAPVPPSRVSARSADGGYILVAVMAVMLLVTGFVAAGSLVVRSALLGARVDADQVFLAGLTQSGVDLVAYQLFVLKLPLHAVDGRRLRLTGGSIRPDVVDEAGKADLNASLPQLLLSEIEATGVAPGPALGAVNRILAMRGEASWSPGAPPPSPPKGPRHRPILSLDVLADMPELADADLPALATRLTVYNPDGKIDILDAAPAVIAAIPGVDPKQVETVVAERDTLSPDQAKALAGRLGGAVASFVKTTPGPAFSLRVDAATRGGRKKSLSVVMASSKSPNVPYYVLDWRD